MDASAFLHSCQKSSQQAFKNFKNLYALLCQSKSRDQALAVWREVFHRVVSKYSPEQALRRYHFSVLELKFEQKGEAPFQLQLLQLPSTFLPEEWSFTFYEGLTRYPPSEYRDRTVLELGCGMGWITLALARRAWPRMIYGVDINPRAILCSKFNLMVNSFSHKGEPVLGPEGQALFQCVEFATSDLYEYCEKQKIYVDRIIGCIPQVLNPDPQFSAALKQDLENKSDHFLYALSNYAAQQGYLEDQFGLGLIARTLEESVFVMRPTGKLILNLGGRPGPEILQQLFERRGFQAKSIWQTRVSQALDTDIQSLVELEKRSSHRFEFFLENSGGSAVSATTAKEYSDAGGRITHHLTVYEAQSRNPIHLPRVFQALRGNELRSVRDVLDLSYRDSSLVSEKASFLETLFQETREATFFPYEATQGLESLRESLSHFLRSYYSIRLSREHFLIAPNRHGLIENLLYTYSIDKALIDRRLIPSAFGNASSVLEIPDNIEVVLELIARLKPQLVVFSMPAREADHKENLARLAEITARNGCHVLVDISELIELSSNPPRYGLFRYLGENALPPHVSLLCGFIKNRLYSDLRLCFLASTNENLLKNLESAAELSYSRTPLLSQVLYQRILEELTEFQIIQRAKAPHKPTRMAGKAPTRLKFSPSAIKAFDHPAIAGEDEARKPGLIRLDYGENCLPMPRALKALILESYARKTIHPQEANCTEEVLSLLRRRFEFHLDKNPPVVRLGCGVAPLFAEFLEYCKQTEQGVVFPQGAYGHFVAAAYFRGTKVSHVRTHLRDQFKLNAAELAKTLAKAKIPSWVVLSAPIVNPTGSIYSAIELKKIFEVAEKFNAGIVLDSIFSGLEFHPDLPGSQPKTPLPHLSHFPNLRWMILGGLSKEFAAAGLRIGYAVSRESGVLHYWKKQIHPEPQATLRFVLKNLYHRYLLGDPDLLNDLSQQREILHKRSLILADTLTTCGWKPLTPSGGLFMVATPVRLPKSRIRSPFPGVVINPPEWTGIPQFYRFVLSVSAVDFEKAIRRIKAS